MEPNAVVTVYTLTDANRAEIIKGALQAEGIHCELEGETQAGFTGLWEIEVMVRAEDADQARKIIQSHEER